VKVRPQTYPSISSESIQAEAGKILASGFFAESERLRRFLQFTLEQTLQGQGGLIKEYSIGIEVFGRGESFDPRTDPVVRVHAGRLRSRLEKYYTTEGREDPVIVEYPKGSYVPIFKLREAAAPAPRSSLGRWWKTIALATSGLMLAGLVIYWAVENPQPNQPAAGPASIAVLPFVDTIQ